MSKQANKILFILFTQIELYFSKLPPQKVPRIGTPGEKWRNQQLLFQLPAQDFSLEYCKHLDNDDARKAFLKFSLKRAKLAFDVGYVTPTKKENSVRIA